MTRVYLVRHGEVANPHRVVYGRLPGWSLSEEGREQAEAVARHLSGRPIVALYSSPLERAQQTAEIIGRRLGLEPVTDEGLTESAMAAAWEGMRWRDVRSQRLAQWQTYRQRPLEVDFVPEPLRALADRAARAVRSVAARHRGKEIVAVSHGDPIKAAVLALAGGDLSRLHDEPLKTGSLIALDVPPEGPATVVERWPARPDAV